MSPEDDNKGRNRRERKRRYRASHRTYSLSFTISEAKEIEREADKYCKTAPQFIKALVEAHLNGNGYVIQDESRLKDLVYQLRMVGSNLNQTVRHINSKKEVSYKDVEQLQNQLNAIENHVVKALTQPTEITQVLQKYLKQNPAKLHTLINWLNQYQP